MSKMLVRLTLISLFLVGAVLPAKAESLTVFGPNQYEVGKGKPVAESVSFSSPRAGADFTLLIRNGDSQGRYKASAAAVSLNGVQVAGPSDFNQQVETIKKTVSVDYFNELSIKVEGKPGSFVSLTIATDGDIGEPAPIATLNAAPETIAAGETSVLAWHTSDADEVLIEPGIGAVAVSGTHTVSPSATTTYTVTAKGAGGTTVATATVTVTQAEPTVSIVSEPSAVVAGESATLSWQSTDAFECAIDNGVGPVAPSGSIVVSPTQTTTYTVTATGPGGTVTSSVLVTVSEPQSPISIGFDDLNGVPLDGATVNASRLSIGGTIASSASSEVGVVVNGVLAQQSGSSFVANHVPLNSGWNTITAQATDGEGNKKQVSANVYSDPASDVVRLSASMESGLSPLEVTFEADTFLSNPVASESLVCNGPTNSEITKSSATEYSATLSGEGLYTCVFKVTDSAGSAFTDKIGVAVMSRAALDAQLQEKWSGMKESLIGGDVEGALTGFIGGVREKYRNTFTLLKDRLPALAAGMQNIELIYARDRVAKYRLTREQIYEGRAMTITYYVYFSKNIDGIWQIQQF